MYQSQYSGAEIDAAIAKARPYKTLSLSFSNANQNIGEDANPTIRENTVEAPEFALLKTSPGIYKTTDLNDFFLSHQGKFDIITNCSSSRNIFIFKFWDSVGDGSGYEVVTDLQTYNGQHIDDYNECTVEIRVYP